MKSWTTKSGQKIYRVLDGRFNSYLIKEGNNYILIDPGMTYNLRKLKKNLLHLGVNSSSLSALILTHSHFDHSQNAADIKKEYGTKIIIHKSEVDFLKNGINPVLRGTVFFTKLIHKAVFNETTLQKYFYCNPVEPDILVDDNYDLNSLGLDAQIVHTPGHTPGSVCVIIGNEIAITGDTMFGLIPRSAYPLYGENAGLILRNWQKLLNTGCSRFLPAHGSERSRKLVQSQYEKYKN